jgi:hypothetical protein
MGELYGFIWRAIAAYSGRSIGNGKCVGHLGRNDARGGLAGYNVRRLYSRIYGRDLPMETILDIIILQTRRIARLVELQSHAMVSSDE